jgi:predicted phosphodiesterase
MRVAALYDIHGNLPALEAVLAEPDVAGADVVLIGGDVAIGPLPRETVERLAALGDRARFVRGNGDREILGPVSADDADLWRVRTSWAGRQLTSDQRDFLASFSENVVLDIEGLGATLFCHGSPRSDEEIVTRITPPERLSEILAGVEQRVTVCGHTHVQFDRVVGGVRIVNAGSVGMPYEDQPGAYWALLGPDVELRRTDYDLERAASVIRAGAFPGADEFAQENVLHPAGAAEATDEFERMATGASG